MVNSKECNLQNGGLQDTVLAPKRITLYMTANTYFVRISFPRGANRFIESFSHYLLPYRVTL